MPIVSIQSRHKRKAFDCGKPKVNAFLHEKGLAEAYGATWVIVPTPDSDEVIGFCTLNPDVAAEEEWDEETAKEVWSVLEWFGVDLHYQRQGWGERILLWVISRTLEKARRYPVIAGLILTPLDEEVRHWYLSRNFGFLENRDGDLYIPVETIRHLPYLAIEEI